ncbi:MAG: hypothetical protein ACP5I4_07835 [Oceanipulchritudo sp.]
MKRLLPILPCILSSLAASAQVTTLVDLDGGTYTATTLSGGAGNFTNSDFDRDGTADDSGKARTFAGSVADSSYVMDGRGSVANLDSATQANWSLFRFLGGTGSNNSIAFRPTSDTDPSTSMAYSAWTSFESSGWLASTAGTGPTGLSLSMDVNNVIVDSTVRFFIKADGEEYVSATFWTGDVTGATIPDVSAELWYVLDAFDIDDLLANTSGSAVLGSTFTNITAVGVQTELVGFDGTVSSTSIGINVDNFVVTAEPLPFTVAAFGESVNYTTSGRALRLVDGSNATASDINRPFSATAPMQPLPGSDPGSPEFFGGWGFADGTGENFASPTTFVNDNALSGGFDGPWFSLAPVATVPETFGFLILFDVNVIDYQTLESFVFAASRTIGAGQSAAARAVVRVGGNYYIGSNETIFNSTYEEYPLDFINLESYDPVTDIVYTAGTPSTLNDTDQVDAVGVYFERRWTESYDPAGGNINFGVGKILVIGFDGDAPEPPPAPTVRILEDSGSIVILTSTQAGTTYQLQKSDTGLSGFADVPGQSTLGDGNEYPFVESLPAAGQKAFYQVRTDP